MFYLVRSLTTRTPKKLATIGACSALLVGSMLTGAQSASAQDVAKQVRGLRKTVKQELEKTNQAISALTAKVSASTAANTTNAKKPPTIANNKSTNNTYVTFDVMPTRKGNVTIHHNGSGVGVRFFLTDNQAQIPENRRFKMEHNLFFPFEGRTADQKAADLHMISTCSQLYNQVLANPEGGSFFLLLSKDDALGFACSSDLTVTYR